MTDSDNFSEILEFIEEFERIDSEESIFDQISSTPSESARGQVDDFFNPEDVDFQVLEDALMAFEGDLNKNPKNDVLDFEKIQACTLFFGGTEIDIEDWRQTFQTCTDWYFGIQTLCDIYKENETQSTKILALASTFSNEKIQNLISVLSFDNPMVEFLWCVVGRRLLDNPCMRGFEEYANMIGFLAQYEEKLEQLYANAKEGRYSLNATVCIYAAIGQTRFRYFNLAL